MCCCLSSALLVRWPNIAETTSLSDCPKSQSLMFSSFQNLGNAKALGLLISNTLGIRSHELSYKCLRKHHFVDDLQVEAAFVGDMRTTCSYIVISCDGLSGIERQKTARLQLCRFHSLKTASGVDTQQRFAPFALFCHNKSDDNSYSGLAGNIKL